MVTRMRVVKYLLVRVRHCEATYLFDSYMVCLIKIDLLLFLCYPYGHTQLQVGLQMKVSQVSTFLEFSPFMKKLYTASEAVVFVVSK